MKTQTVPSVRLHRTPRCAALAALCLLTFALHGDAQSAQDADPAAPAKLDLSVTPAPAWDIDAPSATLAREASAEEQSPTRAERREAKIEDQEQRNTDCESGALHGKPCHVAWGRVLLESLFFLAAQHGGNLALDHDTRVQLTTGDWWAKYVYCVEHYRWSRWKDDDPFGVDYIGHPMMGAFTSFIYEQNDPKQRALLFSNTHQYWNGRLRAMVYSALYSAQWKVGFASEASVGNTGIGYYIRQRDGIYTNETGMQDFFITPIGGLAWNVGEDIADRYLFRRVIRNHKNKLLLIAASLMTPMRAGANVSRFRAMYYRDFDVETAREVRQ